MAFTSPFHMPGAYHFDAPNPSGPTLSAGIFRPPVSPSASNSVLNLARSTGSLCSDTSTTPASNTKRKRTREDGRESTPLTDWTSMNMDGPSDPGSPLGLVDGAETPLDRLDSNRKNYVLAGQIETPGGVVGGLEESFFSDVDYRRALGSKRPHDEMESSSDRLAHLHIGSGPPPVSSVAEGWSVFHTLGGVVGKVWEFCTAGAFRGFYAGGGAGYDLSTREGADGGALSSNQDISSPPAEAALSANQVPGGFPESDYVPYLADYHETSTPVTNPRPAAKRRQVSEVGEELRRNWVMVPEQEDQAQIRKHASLASASPSISTRAGSRQQQRPPAPPRRISIPVSRLAVTPNQNRRPPSRISHAGSPNLTAREPASFAQPRSPISASRPPLNPSSRIPVASHSPNPFARAASPRPGSRQSGVASPVQNASSGGHAHRRTQSNASAASTSRRKTGLDAEDIEASPRLDAEAKHLATRKLAVERDTDVRIEAFNARLRDMIRQGREALGTTVEVDDEGGTGGIWMDDD